MIHIINFNGYKLSINKRNYSNGRIALQLIDTEDGFPFATATVNIPEAQISDDEVIIKDYSENAGILDCLVKHKIISNPIDRLNTGFVTVEICKLLI